MRFNKSNGVLVGGNEDNLYRVSFREWGDAMGEPIDLFTGDKEMLIDTGYNDNVYLFIRRDQPFPVTILAIMPRLKTSNSGVGREVG